MIIFTLIALLPILILGSIQVRRIADAHEADKARQARMDAGLADDIGTYVDNHKHVVNALAGEISVSNHRSYVELGAVLRSLAKNFPGFVNLYVADRDGRNLAFYSAGGEAEPELRGYDFSTRGYYAEIAREHRTVISSLFQGEVTTRRPLIVIASPTYDEAGVFSGYVSAALDLSEVKALAEKYSYGTMGYAMVIDQSGRLIYHPEEAAGEALLSVAEDDAVKAMRERGTGTGEFYSGLNQQAEFMAFTTLPELGWMVVVGKPASVYRAEFVQAIKGTLALLLATAAACLLLSWLLASALNYPIRLFVDYTKAIGEQNFELCFPKLAAWRMPREMMGLAEHFLIMARQLKEKQSALLALAAQLEHRVEERTDNLQAVLDSMSDAIVMVDRERRIIYANRRMATLFGDAPPPLVGKTEADFKRALHANAEGDGEALEALFSAPSGSCTIAIRRADAVRKIAVTAFSVKSAKRKTVLGKGYLCADVTERHEVDQLKNNLISLAAHEFKTPLTGIRGSVETLLREDVAWEAAFQREMLDGVLEDVLRIQLLVDDWLDISKIDANMLQLHREYFSVEALIRQVEKRLRRRKKDFSLRLVIAPALPAFYGDKRRMEQVVFNVMDNAILYSARAARIEIAASADESAYYLSIADRGIGIGEAHLAHIFERFYRADVTSTRASGGTGLGLAICKGIVEAHHGTIRVESKKDCGSRFTITLPREEVRE